MSGAAARLEETEQSVRKHNFVYRIPEVAAAQILTFLHQGKVAEAAHLAQTHNLPLSQARVHLAQGDPAAALRILTTYRQHVEAKNWRDEHLKAMVLQAVAYEAQGEKEQALQTLDEVLTLAEPSSFIRIFVDEGRPMEQLVSEAATKGIMPAYMSKLLTAFEAEKQKDASLPRVTPIPPLIESLSQRELEVLQLISQGLSNDEIGKRLFLALDTVKGHNRRIFDKLGVQRRTEAVARARELGLL